MADSLSKRISILTQKEIQGLYGFPHFSDEERMIYFSLSQQEQIVVNSHRSVPSKIYFILQSGYFKAKKMFFLFSKEEVKEDIHYVIQRYYPDLEPLDIEIPKKINKLVS